MICVPLWGIEDGHLTPIVPLEKVATYQVIAFEPFCFFFPSGEMETHQTKLPVVSESFRLWSVEVWRHHHHHRKSLTRVLLGCSFDIDKAPPPSPTKTTTMKAPL